MAVRIVPMVFRYIGDLSENDLGPDKVDGDPDRDQQNANNEKSYLNPRLIPIDFSPRAKFVKISERFVMQAILRQTIRPLKWYGARPRPCRGRTSRCLDGTSVHWSADDCLPSIWTGPDAVLSDQRV